MKKIVALLLAMMLVIGVLAACSPSAPAQTTPDPAPTEDPGTGAPAETTAPVDESAEPTRKFIIPCSAPIIPALTSLITLIPPSKMSPPIA